MARRDIAFDAEGVTLRGWCYADENSAPRPTVVMAHGFSAVKEMYLDSFAEVFAAAGRMPWSSTTAASGGLLKEGARVLLAARAGPSN